MARRLTRDIHQVPTEGSLDAARVDYSFMLGLSQAPTAVEYDTLIALLRQQNRVGHRGAAEPSSSRWQANRPDGVEKSELAGLDEFITRE